MRWFEVDEEDPFIPIGEDEIRSCLEVLLEHRKVKNSGGRTVLGKGTPCLELRATLDDPRIFFLRRDINGVHVGYVDTDESLDELYSWAKKVGANDTRGT